MEENHKMAGQGKISFCYIQTNDATKAQDMKANVVNEQSDF